LLLASGTFAVLYWLWAPRPEALGLEKIVDGPNPADASQVIVFLHGYGAAFKQGEEVARELRSAGLPGDVSVVLVQGPYRSGFLDYSWGRTAAEGARSRARIRSLIADLHAQHRIVLVGFSQGAAVALDIAAEEPRIAAVASFSPCSIRNREKLADRDLRFLLAHGTRDGVCPVDRSRSLAKALESAKKSVRYVEFDGGHEISPEAVKALAAFATP
jgi:phospholipase/carboxylesterase